MAAADGTKQQQQQQQQQQEARGASANGSRDEARTRSKSPAGHAERADVDGTSGHAEEQELEKNKVFVGNLSYGIAEQDLEAYFAQIGKVLNATIVKRRGRPVGFGFVTFESEEVAQHAVSTLDQTVCDGRQINVEVTSSRPRDRKPRSEGKPRRVRRPRRRGSEKTKAESAPQGQDTGERGPLEGWQGEKLASENGADERPPRRPRARRERKPRNKAHGGGDGEQLQEDGEGGQPAEAAEKQERRKRRQAHNRGRAPAGGEEATAAEGQATNEDGPVRAPRPPRGPRGQRAARRQKGPPSDRTIFVANLPFSMDSEQLEKLFAGFKAASVRVIQRRGTKRNKGFGFVEMVDHDEQTRAINEFRGDRVLEVDGRVLTLSVALDEVEGSQEVHAETSDPAPARIDE